MILVHNKWRNERNDRFIACINVIFNLIPFRWWINTSNRKQLQSLNSVYKLLQVSNKNKWSLQRITYNCFKFMLICCMTRLYVRNDRVLALDLTWVAERGFPVMTCAVMTNTEAMMGTMGATEVLTLLV